MWSLEGDHVPSEDDDGSTVYDEFSVADKSLGSGSVDLHATAYNRPMSATNPVSPATGSQRLEEGNVQRIF